MENEDLQKKLKSQKGESIGEVLVAMLIVALGSVMFASMVTASQRLVTKSKNAYKAFNDARNQIENESGSIITPNVAATVLIKSDSDPKSVTDNKKICNIDEQARENVTVFIDDKATDNVKKMFIYEPEKNSQTAGGNNS